MCPFHFTAFCGYWEGWVPVNRFIQTSWMTVVTPIDRPKSACNRCVIEVLGGVFVLSIVFQIFCWYMGFCHRTESDLLLYLFQVHKHKRKRKDLTQSYDQSLYIHRKLQNATRQHKHAIETFDYTTIVGRLTRWTVSCSNNNHPTGELRSEMLECIFLDFLYTSFR